MFRHWLQRSPQSGSRCLVEYLPLSPGDRLRINIPADEGLPETDRFSGVYEVNLDGTLQLPFIDPVPVVGLELPQVQQQLTRLLINEGFFQPNFLRVSVSIIEWAPVQVTVSGAVFEPVPLSHQPASSGWRRPPDCASDWQLSPQPLPHRRHPSGRRHSPRSRHHQRPLNSGRGRASD
uniref:Polysaccharide biosynthesis/export family protein n=1 Tax=Desertifilum tharense IPPAS B-1220 TaxID=1781255 RepID=A0ACD5GX53_9CYAN